MRLPFRRSRSNEVVVYSRPGCPLCQSAERRLRQRIGRGCVKVIDISGDSSLEGLYSLRIPVVAVGGRIVAEGVITDAEMELIVGDLKAQSRQAPYQG